MLRNIFYRIVYRERATPRTYIKFLKKKCLFFGDNVFFVNTHKTYIDKDALQFIHIGNYCQILSGVTVLAHDESYSVCGLAYGDYPRAQKKTVIGDNVFIGMNSIILMGSNIGNNVIIGAGSIVSGEIESNSVYAGNPAKKIMSLDDYYKRHFDSFADSAYLYIKTFINYNNRIPSIEECHVYSLLFKDEIKNEYNKWPEANKKVSETNKNRKKYYSVEEFLEEYENK